MADWTKKSMSLNKSFVLVLAFVASPATGFLGHAKAASRCAPAGATSPSRLPETDRTDYVARQRDAFDESAVFFASDAAVPPEVCAAGARAH
jgi:hypothetical protein